MKKKNTRQRPTTYEISKSLGIQGISDFDVPILAALATGSTLLLIGAHGSAKTLLAEKVAFAVRESFRHYNTSLLNYDDLVGYPVPDAEKKELAFIQTPGNIWDAGFVLFDEISRARPEIQNKIFPIIHEHRIQGIPLNSLKHCWAAMNPPSDGDDTDFSIYTGSWSLDMALSDRFSFVLKIPEFNQLDQDSKRAVLKYGGENNQRIEINRLIKSTLKYLEQTKKEFDEWTVKYLDILLPHLETSGLQISGRRARMIYDNILVSYSASKALGVKSSFGDSALRTVLFSLPHDASGITINRGKVVIAHKDAVEAAGENKDSPKHILRKIDDPIKKVIKALELKLDKYEMSKILSSTIAALDTARRYAFCYFMYPELSQTSNVNAATFEILSGIQANIVQGAEEEATGTASAGTRRWKIWEGIADAIARKEKPELIAIARGILFFGQECIPMEEILTAYKDVQMRIAA
jgi:MoxR-like ATPase